MMLLSFFELLFGFLICLSARPTLHDRARVVLLAGRVTEFTMIVPKHSLLDIRLGDSDAEFGFEARLFQWEMIV